MTNIMFKHESFVYLIQKWQCYVSLILRKINFWSASCQRTKVKSTQGKHCKSNYNQSGSSQVLCIMYMRVKFINAVMQCFFHPKKINSVNYSVSGSCQNSKAKSTQGKHWNLNIFKVLYCLKNLTFKWIIFIILKSNFVENQWFRWVTPSSEKLHKPLCNRRIIAINLWWSIYWIIKCLFFCLFGPN